MLYKKYHRNFVKRFKKGVKFRFDGYSGFKEVVIEPFIVSYRLYRYVSRVDVMILQDGNIDYYPEHWNIISPRGVLGNMNLRLRFIENAIQEIS